MGCNLPLCMKLPTRSLVDNCELGGMDSTALGGVGACKRSNCSGYVLDALGVDNRAPEI